MASNMEMIFYFKLITSHHLKYYCVSSNVSAFEAWQIGLEWAIQVLNQKHCKMELLDLPFYQFFSEIKMRRETTSLGLDKV